MDTPQFYAFTFEKLIADLFKETRNMNRFKQKCVDIPTESVNTFTDRFQQYKLSITGFKTKGIDTDTIVLEFPATYKEPSFVTKNTLLPV